MPESRVFLSILPNFKDHLFYRTLLVAASETQILMGSMPIILTIIQVPVFPSYRNQLKFVKTILAQPSLKSWRKGCKQIHEIKQNWFFYEMF